MKTLIPWLSPFDPRGMSVWGCIACAILTYGLYGVQGRLVEVWPNRCSLIKSQLLRVSTDQVFEGSKDSFTHPLLIKNSSIDPEIESKYWLIKTASSKQTSSWIIPKGDYKEAKVKFNRLKPIWVEFVNQTGPNLTLIYEPEQSPIELYKYLMQAKGLKEAKYIMEQQTVSRLNLEKIAFEKTPQDLTCHRELMEKELHILVAMLLKSTELGLKSVQELETGLWLSERQVANRWHYRVKTWMKRLAVESREVPSGFWSLSWVKDSIHLKDTQSSPSIHGLDLPTTMAPKWLVKLLEVLAEAEEPSVKLMSKLTSISPKVKLVD